MPFRELVAVDLVLLTVADCPNAAAFEEHLAAALAGHPAAAVRRRVVADEREAAEAGMHGSPTLLVDGTDPFAAPGEPPSLSCRLYRDAAGRAAAVPSAAELRRVLTAAGEDLAWQAGASPRSTGSPSAHSHPGLPHRAATVPGNAPPG